ncbi:hypothetical protein Taro_012820 [Colocasia esculenta]|uniref:Uncharacterized protein n=1 Tax=Colocasia esculenta TaxID=4460 RepID=A0A843UA82_COLES|nr:hypothetical protein [Colocasia esculenta]
MHELRVGVLLEVLLEELLEVLLGIVVVAPATTSIFAPISFVAAIFEDRFKVLSGSSAATCRQPAQNCRQAHVFQNSRFLDCVDLSTGPLLLLTGTHRSRKPELCLLLAVDSSFLAVDSYLSTASPKLSTGACLPELQVIQLGMTFKGLSAEWTH